MLADVAVAAFIGDMEANGIGPAEPIAHSLLSGKLVRFQVQGDRAGRRNGWAVLHTDGRAAGAYGCNKRGVSLKWRDEADRPRLSPAERAANRLRWKVAQEAKRKETDAEHRAVAARAAGIVAAGGPVNQDHPYLIGKRIDGHGLLQQGSALIVPMRDADGTIWNVQRIFPGKEKRFLKGGKQSGLFWLLGRPDGVVCIGEGMGTMAAVRRATGHAVVAAFTEKNLEPVARTIAGLFPDCDLILCADDDAHLVDHPTIKRNIGLDAAHRAALAVGGRVAVPPRKDFHHG